MWNQRKPDDSPSLTCLRTTALCLGSHDLHDYCFSKLPFPYFDKQHTFSTIWAILSSGEKVAAGFFK